MNTVEIRELTDADLDLVSGGADPNFQYCANGPAGSGVYPDYINCNGPTLRELLENIVRGAQQTLSGGRPA